MWTLSRNSCDDDPCDDPRCWWQIDSEFQFLRGFEHWVLQFLPWELKVETLSFCFPKRLLPGQDLTTRITYCKDDRCPSPTQPELWMKNVREQMQQKLEALLFHHHPRYSRSEKSKTVVDLLPQKKTTTIARTTTNKSDDDNDDTKTKTQPNLLQCKEHKEICSRSCCSRNTYEEISLKNLDLCTKAIQRKLAKEKKLL